MEMTERGRIVIGSVTEQGRVVTNNLVEASLKVLGATETPATPVLSGSFSVDHIALTWT